MAITISTPQFSFVQFSETGVVESCLRDINLCLPVYESSDVAFQFVLNTTTEEEADLLCGLDNDITIGISADCSTNLLTFEEKPQRFRIGERQVLYLWEEGLHGFDTVREIGQCFVIRVTTDEISFCSNCFQRIGDPCHTSVVEYYNEENGFGFNYCMSEGEEVDGAVCDPMYVSFTNQETLVIPYTASMLADYGNLPTVQVWIYDPITGELTDMNINVRFDTYPPTEIRIDFGGPASGVIKIS